LAFSWRGMSIRIYLTGRLAVEVDERVVIDGRDFRGKQGRLVFAYLVSERTRPVTRDELAEVVWPADFAPSWESGLSALMSRLHRLLAALADRGVSTARGFGQYRILLPSDAWIDTEAGVSAIDRAEAAIRAGRPEQVLGPATVAATIARRSFLTGVRGEWVDSQRRRLERQLLRALDCLSEMRLASGEPGLAVETATEAVTLDPYRERGYQLLMRGAVATGNKANAVQAYHRLRELLADELGTEPSHETEALYLAALG